MFLKTSEAIQHNLVAVRVDIGDFVVLAGQDEFYPGQPKQELDCKLEWLLPCGGSSGSRGLRLVEDQSRG